MDFSYNQIVKVNPQVFVNFTQLVSVSLDNNIDFKLSNENDPVLVSSSLRTFSCNECKITKISSKTFSLLPDLEKLSLNGNGVTSIAPDAFKSNANLAVLSLKGNKLMELPEKLVEGNLKLQVLHIDNNRLYNFPKARPILISKTLKTFTCSGCGITEIHMKTLSKLSQLSTLHLQMNSISYMHELSFAETSQLHFINLESNNLTEPPVSILKEGTVLEELCLGGNPIQWTSESYEFYHKLSHNSCNIVVQTETTTASTTPYLTTEKTIEDETVNPTLLDALIATYLLVCVILESLLFAAISLYLARIVQTKSKDFDYSASVINPSDIYKIN